MTEHASQGTAAEPHAPRDFAVGEEERSRSLNVSRQLAAGTDGSSSSRHLGRPSGRELVRQAV